MEETLAIVLGYQGPEQRSGSPLSSSPTFLPIPVPDFQPRRALLLSSKPELLGHLGGSVVGRLPLALGSRDRVPHRAPCMEPASPSAYVSASVCVCVSHE